MIYADISYSKELKDEFPESEWWYWVDPKDKIRIVNRKPFSLELQNNDYGYPVNYYPALHTDMLLERLPAKIADKEYKLTIDKNKIANEDLGYRVFYILIGSVKKKYKDRHFMDKSLPNALATMMVWLKTKGLLDERD